MILASGNRWISKVSDTQPSVVTLKESYLLCGPTAPTAARR